MALKLKLICLFVPNKRAMSARINRGYYMAVRRYEFYFRVVKTIFYERVQRVSNFLFIMDIRFLCLIHPITEYVQIAIYRKIRFLPTFDHKLHTCKTVNINHLVAPYCCNLTCNNT